MSQLFSKKPPKLSWEYLAGFFDGEGCISVRKNNYRPGVNESTTVHLAIYQNSVEVLSDIKKFLKKNGVSSVYEGKSGKNGHSLQICKRADVLLVLGLMISFMRVKRDMAIECYIYMQAVDDMIKENGMHWFRNGFRLTAPLSVRQR